jgi:kinesin family protein 2/24
MPPRVHGQNHGGVGMSVRVIVRKRPTQEDENDILEVHPPVVTVYVQKVRVDLTKYQFAQSFRVDDSFSEADSTRELYDRSVRELVRNVYEAGGTSTAFCFGQTASGKTYTLFGAGGGLVAHETSLGHSGEAKAEQGGLYLLAAYEIYQRAQAETDPGMNVTISLSMYEIKGQRMYDLLNDRSELQALEDSDGVLQLVGLSQHACESIHDFIDVSNAGRSARSTAATGANATSSRSHCAMLVRIYRNGDLLGKLSLIDLAGSERGADNEDTDATTRREGRDINTSLLALKEVIRALQSGKHAPFRQSRLTQVLEESLTGPNCRTVVIACVSGAKHDTQHTVNTLRYAQDLRPGSTKLVKSPRKTMTAPADKSRPSVRPPMPQKGPKKRNSFLMGAKIFSPRLDGSRKQPPPPRETLGLGSLSPGISGNHRISSDDLDLTVNASPAHPSQPLGGGAKRSGAQRVLSGLAGMTPRSVMRRSSHRILSGHHSPVPERPSSQPNDQWLSPNSLLTAELNMDSPPHTNGNFHPGQTGLGSENGRFSLLEPPTPPPSLPPKAARVGRSPAQLPLPSPPHEEDRNRTSVPTSPLKAKSSGRARTFRLPSYSTGRASSKAAGASPPFEERNNPINRASNASESPLTPHVGFRLPGESSRGNNGRTSRDDDYLLSRTTPSSSRANRGCVVLKF